jgi:hypothetical protein
MKAVIALALFAALTTSAASAEQRAADWASLASAIPTRHGTEWITVGRQAGAFHSLRIEALSGTVHVRSIRVEFSNGRISTFYVARTLDRRHPQTFVELNAPRFIESIAITTARRPAGSYAVFGARGLVPGYDLIATISRTSAFSRF